MMLGLDRKGKNGEQRVHSSVAIWVMDNKTNETKETWRFEHPASARLCEPQGEKQGTRATQATVLDL